MKKKTVKLMFVLLCTTLVGFSQEPQKNYPNTYLGDVIKSETTITKAALLETLLANSTITVRKEICSEETWIVQSFQISLLKGAMQEGVPVSVTGNTIPQNVLDNIQKLEPPFAIEIAPIRAISSLNKEPAMSHGLWISVKE